MEEAQTSTDLIDKTCDALSHLSVSTQPDIKYKPMPDPLSVYVPLDSLTEETINSIVLTVLHSEKKDLNNSKRTLLAFLLAINERVNEIEKNNDSNNKFNQETVQHAEKIRQWLVEKDQSDNIKMLNWDELRATYDMMASDNDDGCARHYNVQNYEPYYELTIEGLHPDIIRSREYMSRFRSQGWEPNELKIYWNAKQLENLCPKEEKNDLPPHDPSDADVIVALRQYPVSKRNHDVTITYVNKGIEKAVFDAPEDAQLIVLNFAVSYSSTIVLVYIS